MVQVSFNPVDFGFEFVGSWYKFDRVAAKAAAMKARNDYAKAQRALGNQVSCWSMADQLITMGGIGSGHPQIEVCVTCYVADVRKVG
jgi:hypothetical protein